MKRILAVFSIFFLLFTSLAYAQVKVKGYYRKDGTYVQPHYRSKPNKTVTDNYSFKGNVNPYTGKEGTNYYRNSPSSPYYGTTSSRKSSLSNSRYNPSHSSDNSESDSGYYRKSIYPSKQTYKSKSSYYQSESSYNPYSSKSNSSSLFDDSDSDSKSDSGSYFGSSKSDSESSLWDY